MTECKELVYPGTKRFLSYASLTTKEYEDYTVWRRNHFGNVEFRIIPDSVSQSVKVKCLSCNEEVDITDWDSA